MQPATVGSHSLKYLPTIVASLLVAAAFLSSPRPAATGPVAEALKSASSSDRAKLASIYSALADVIARDKGQLISTTAAWRAIYSDALRLAAGGTDLVGKYPGLDQSVEQVLKDFYPLENVAIDDALASKIAAGMRAVERQCE